MAESQRPCGTVTLKAALWDWPEGEDGEGGVPERYACKACPCKASYRILT